jgi:hypothetical protein
MATIIDAITGTTAQATLTNNALCARHGYQEIIDEKPNPQSKADFARSVVIKMIKDEIKAYKIDIAIPTARTSAITEANSESDGIT